jgi:hypothetical protein
MNTSNRRTSKSQNSTDENYYLANNIKEQIELKNIVQTKGRFYFKQRFAILTTSRMLVFENKDKFLHKKNPRVK